MLTDRWGLPVATDHPAVIAGLDTFDTSFLTYGTTASAIWDAAKADPACVLAQAKAAALELLMQTGDAAEKARRWLVGAEPHLTTATEREALWHAMVASAAEGTLEQAIAISHTIVARWPEDLAAMKWAHYLMFKVGDAPGMLAVARAAFPAHREVPEMNGMLAFALEETHQLAEAEVVARRAIELQRAEPWAHHALAHVMEAQGRCVEGFELMASLADTWSDRNSFMRTHNWWHTGLFAIDSDRLVDALELFDRQVWGVVKAYSQDQVNAVALLARLELSGLDVGDRWQDVADYIERRGPEHVEPFLDAHYLLGLTRAGRTTAAHTLLASLRDHVARQPERMTGRIWRSVGLPLGEGVAAYGAGDWKTAFSALRLALDGLHQIGGSHAQRDLFWQLWLHAGAKLGEIDVVWPYFEQRIEARPGVAKLRRELAALVG
jgi:tetratricopeptide (TPR) repeat protein